MAAPAAVTSRVLVPGTPDQVRQAVTDWPGQRRWMVGTLGIAAVPAPNPSP